MLSNKKKWDTIIDDNNRLTASIIPIYTLEYASKTQLNGNFSINEGFAVVSDCFYSQDLNNKVCGVFFEDTSAKFIEECNEKGFATEVGAKPFEK